MSDMSDIDTLIELVQQRDAARRTHVILSHATWHDEVQPTLREIADIIYPGQGAALFPDCTRLSLHTDRMDAAREAFCNLDEGLAAFVFDGDIGMLVAHQQKAIMSLGVLLGVVDDEPATAQEPAQAPAPNPHQWDLRRLGGGCRVCGAKSGDDGPCPWPRSGGAKT